MTATVNDVLTKAASQIGYYAPANGPTKYGIWYGIPNGQWCGMFVSWVAEDSGAHDIIPKNAYTPTGAKWYENNAQWHYGAGGIRRGDQVYFDFGLGRISHTGLVETVNSDGTFYTIEGNTSGYYGGVHVGSGLCARKQRGNRYVVGYGRPAYADAPQDTRPRNLDGSLTLVIDGSRGPLTISRWQSVLGTPQDGFMSSPVSTVVRADQSMLNSVVSGANIRALTGRIALVCDGMEGRKTVLVRQLWLKNVLSIMTQQTIIGHMLADDGSFGPESIKCFQWALNRASARSGRY
jgi:hypothetical protein